MKSLRRDTVQSAPGSALKKLVWRRGIKESSRVEDVLSLGEDVCEEETLSRASDRSTSAPPLFARSFFTDGGYTGL